MFKHQASDFDFGHPGGRPSAGQTGPISPMGDVTTTTPVDAVAKKPVDAVTDFMHSFKTEQLTQEQLTAAQATTTVTTTIKLPAFGDMSNSEQKMLLNVTAKTLALPVTITAAEEWDGKAGTFTPSIDSLSSKLGHINVLYLLESSKHPLSKDASVIRKAEEKKAIYKGMMIDVGTTAHEKFENQLYAFLKKFAGKAARPSTQVIERGSEDCGTRLYEALHVEFSPQASLKDVAIQASKVVAVATSPFPRHSHAPHHREQALARHLDDYKRIAGKPYDEWELALGVLEGTKNSPAAEWTSFYGSTLACWRKRQAGRLFKFNDLMEALKCWGVRNLPAYMPPAQGNEKAFFLDVEADMKDGERVDFSPDIGQTPPAQSSLSHGTKADDKAADTKTTSVPDKFKFVKCISCGQQGHPASRCPDNEVANFVSIISYEKPTGTDSHSDSQAPSQDRMAGVLTSYVY